MTLDSSDSLSTADESHGFPKGILRVGADASSASKVEEASLLLDSAAARRVLSTSEKSTSWSYLFLHHQAARKLQKWLEAYNAAVAADDAESGETKGEAHAQPFFVHQSYRYQYKDKARERGVTKTLEPSVSGLVFLQGSVSGLQSFLRQYFPQYHLVLDRTCGRPASIEDTVMRPFMRVARTHPERVTFLRDNLERFARDHARLRVLSGPFAGCEGYVVRIARDRQLVFDFGGCAVAVRGVHSEEFEVVG